MSWFAPTPPPQLVLVQLVTRDGQTMRGYLDSESESGVVLRRVQYVSDDSPRYSERNVKNDLYEVFVPDSNHSFYSVLVEAA